MRYILGLICVFALSVVTLLGCSETAGDGGSGGSGGSAGAGGEGGDGGVGGDDSCEDTWDCPCLRPLDEYCEYASPGSACPTWEQAIAAAEEFAQQGVACDQGFGCFSEAGQCGDLRYVRTGCNDGDEASEYFDTSGTLVAVDWWSDGCSTFCDHSCGANFGYVTTCEEEKEQDFCEPPP